MSDHNSNQGAIVRVDGVEKIFRRGSEEIHVLSNLTLQVPTGEFLALMGPSGSGKSTLLNLIGGLDRPTKGTVEVAGDRIDTLSDRQLAAWRARHIGFVFQLYNLMPVLPAGGAGRSVLLPKGAVQSLDGRDVVFVILNGRAERRAVTVAGTQDAEATLSAGVAAGEKVALDFPPGLTDGANVKERNL